MVVELESSREPVERFAKRRGVRLQTLRWWMWRLSRDAVRVLPVVVREDRAAEGARSGPVASAAHVVELAIGDVHVRFGVGADASYVASLVAELRARC